MRAHRQEFEITRMCEVLQVSRSGYYGWAGRGESKRSEQDRVLLKEIRKVHQESKEAYGATKTWRTLKESGRICGRHRVARLRRQAGIEARRLEIELFHPELNGFDQIGRIDFVMLLLIGFD